MNRLAPLIVRRSALLAGAASPRIAAARQPDTVSAPTGSDDLRMFATSFLGGLVFFGTYLA
jgi:hypothetical protein